MAVVRERWATSSPTWTRFSLSTIRENGGGRRIVIRARLILAAGCLLLPAFMSTAQTTNQFVATLNQKWVQQNASNVLTFVESELQQRPSDPQVLFARAVVAGELQLWNRGATNFISQAITNVNLSTQYTAGKKAALTKELQEHLRFFSLTVSTFGEATNSAPQWNAAIQGELFQTSSNAFPYIDTLLRFDN
jgi:hypothetical protein